MKCEHCGNVVSESDKFCNGCGAKIERVQPEVNQTLTTAQFFTPPTTLEDGKIASNVSDTASTKKKSKIPMIILIVFLFIGTLAAGGVGGYYLLKSSTEEEEKEENKTPEVLPTSTSSVYFAGANFSVSDDYDYQVNDGQLFIVSDNWYSVIQENPYSYSTMYTIRENYKSVLESSLGMTASSVSEEKINGSKYLLYNVTKDGIAYLLAFREYTTSSTLLIMVQADGSNKLDISYLGEIDTILSTADIRTIDKNMESGFEGIDKYIDIIKSIPVEEVVE